MHNPPKQRRSVHDGIAELPDGEYVLVEERPASAQLPPPLPPAALRSDTPFQVEIVVDDAAVPPRARRRVVPSLFIFGGGIAVGVVALRLFAMQTGEHAGPTGIAPAAVAAAQPAAAPTVVEPPVVAEPVPPPPAPAPAPPAAEVATAPAAPAAAASTPPQATVARAPARARNRPRRPRADTIGDPFSGPEPAKQAPGVDPFDK